MVNSWKRDVRGAGFGKSINKSKILCKINKIGTYLLAQCLRICLALQGFDPGHGTKMAHTMEQLSLLAQVESLCAVPKN